MLEGLEPKWLRLHAPCTKTISTDLVSRKYVVITSTATPCLCMAFQTAFFPAKHPHGPVAMWHGRNLRELLPRVSCCMKRGMAGDLSRGAPEQIEEARA